MSAAILRRDVDLARATTLGTRCVAERAVLVSSLPDLQFARQLAHVRQESLSVLGGGSNVILAPRLAGVTALIRTRGITLLPSRSTADLVVAAGESWHGLVRYSLAKGLAGLECLALIPGLVGAAPVQNIGAYGTELAQVLRWVEVYDLATDRFYRLSAEHCALGYRESRFKQPDGRNLVIVRVCIRLHQGHASRVSATRYPDVELELHRMGLATRAATPLQLAEAVIRIRRRKLPNWRHVGNVGSTFKNPTVTSSAMLALRQNWPQLKATTVADGWRLSAAQLIDLAGQKTLRVGEARPWFRQPLVLTLPLPEPKPKPESKPVDEPEPEPESELTEGSSVADFLTLAASIRDAVHQQFAVALELEPQLLGPLALPPAGS